MKIKLKESEFKSLIQETVKRVLKENNEFDQYMDLKYELINSYPHEMKRGWAGYEYIVQTMSNGGQLTGDVLNFFTNQLERDVKESQDKLAHFIEFSAPYKKEVMNHVNSQHQSPEDQQSQWNAQQ